MKLYRGLPALLLCMVLATAWDGSSFAAGFPEKPITLIVPYPAGGATDVVIRPLAEATGKILGQPMLVENKGGGAVGRGSIVGREPDGYLLSVVVTSLHRAAHINKLAFDTVKEAGYKVVHDSPIGIVGPKGMAPERVKRLHDAFQKALSDPAFLKAMQSYEMPVLYQNTADFTKFWADAYVEAGEQVKNYIKP